MAFFIEATGGEKLWREFILMAVIASEGQGYFDSAAAALRLQPLRSG
jgi:hypothetical protein